MESSSGSQPTHTDAVRHYVVERQLADRLRSASKEERLGGLYASIYAERIARIPTHPLVIRSRDVKAQERSTEAQLRLLRPWLTPESVFMEVGPGDCALSHAVARFVKTVYAVDVTDALVGDVRRPTNFRFLRSDGVNVPVPASVVDLAYSNQVLEHLHPDDVQDHLRSIQTALVPGGRLVCVTPNRLSGPWDISRHFDDESTGLHLREYTVSELADLLRATGFRVALVASWRGRGRLRVGEGPTRAFEERIDELPRRVRRPLASALSAVKVVATKT
jgi:SAM-dependent methyltransferase